MSKVLRLLDFSDHLTFDHEDWLIEQEMKKLEETENENGWDEEQDEDDREFIADDIPF